MLHVIDVYLPFAFDISPKELIPDDWTVSFKTSE